MNEFNERKVIRNRQIVREIDRNSALELRWSIVLGFVFAGLVCVYNWQQHQMVEFRYRIEELKKETNQIVESRQKLSLEQATLESPARIYQLAHDELGLITPKPHQMIFDTARVQEVKAREAVIVWDLRKEDRRKNSRVRITQPE